MRLVACIAVTRPDRLPRVVANLGDCDDILTIEDDMREGMAKTRNRFLDRVRAGDVLRFVDDDDIAFNSALLGRRYAKEKADVLAFSFVSSNACVPVATDPVVAAMASISSWNWLIGAEAAWRVRDRFGELFVTEYRHNIGVWTWLRLLEMRAENSLRIATAPDLYGYSWHRLAEPSSMSDGNAEIGQALRLNLKARALDTGNSDALAQLAGRLGSFGQHMRATRYVVGT